MHTEITFAAYRIEMRSVSTLTPYAGNARTHSRKQIRQIADSIRRFGFTNPVLISDEGEIIAGHGRVLAAKELGMTRVPTLQLSHLSAAERRAYVLADNKLAMNAGWDTELLAIELQALIDLDFDVALTGFSSAEVDFFLDQASERSPDKVTPVDIVPSPPLAPITRQGDLWLLGPHRLLCGDARNTGDYQLLLQEESVDLIFTDPPYNVRINGNVSGLGLIKHREFAMASGEMSQEAFTDFLTLTLSNAAATCRDGAIAFVCMDWRHMDELLSAGRKSFTELKNLCVWNKTNGGMGTFYRSKHELIFVFKIGTAPHTNNFGLGDGGRYRTNVWDYPGISSLSRDRPQLQEMHPTVKPTVLVADAIRDCSKRSDVILDGFGGSGTTLIAAEACGRRARLIEYDASYCDTIITRWETLTGKRATLSTTGERFEDVAEQRSRAISNLNPEIEWTL
jgi:DNA modification methylase